MEESITEAVSSINNTTTSTPPLHLHLYYIYTTTTSIPLLHLHHNYIYTTSHSLASLICHWWLSSNIKTTTKLSSSAADISTYGKRTQGTFVLNLPSEQNIPSDALVPIKATWSKFELVARFTAFTFCLLMWKLCPSLQDTGVRNQHNPDLIAVKLPGEPLSNQPLACLCVRAFQNVWQGAIFISNVRPSSLILSKS